MAQIIIEFPDGIGVRVNNLLGRRWEYQDQIEDPGNPGSMIPNPETKVAFNKRKVVEWIKGEAVNQEVRESGETAQDTQRPVSESELNITSA